MAVAMSSRSSERTRRTMFSRALSKGSPRFTSRMTRPNSIEMGGRLSRTTSSIAWRNEEPARRALAMRVIVSGSCLLKAESRPFLRRPSQKRGSQKPRSTPPRSTIGLPRAGKMTERTSMMRGTPTIEAAQMRRYSLTLRCRSARARSRARLAPKSRCSTALLKVLRASLLLIMSPRLAGWALLAVASRPEA